MSNQFLVEELLVTEAQEHSPVIEVVVPGDEVVYLNDEDKKSEKDLPVVEVVEHSQSPQEIVIVIEDIPGAPPGTKDPEPVVEVKEESEPVEDENELKNKKKSEKWDWAAKGADGFIAWVHERIQNCPKHSGYDSAGLERAISYLDKLDSEISRAMRLDLDGELDANKIEETRAQIYNGVNKLNDRLDKVTKDKKKKKKKASYEIMVKEAQKSIGVSGIVATVPLIALTIARVCINGLVSAGHDIEKTFRDLTEKYKLNEREKAEVVQLLSDMGYNLFQDRGKLNEEFDPTSSNNYDFSAQWQA